MSGAEGEFFVDVPDDAPSYQDSYEWKPLTPPLGDDEVTALTERLRQIRAYHRGPWLEEFCAEIADALERLTAERDALAQEVDRLHYKLDHGSPSYEELRAERDALPEKIAQAIEAATEMMFDHSITSRVYKDAAHIARSFGAATPGEDR